MRQALLIFLACLGSAWSFAQPVANFGASPSSTCAPHFVQFTDSSTGTITNWSWNLGNSVTSSAQNPSTTYSVPGTYTVTLTVSGPSGSSVKTSSIIVYDTPAVSFTASPPIAVCPQTSVQFSGMASSSAPGGISYSWDFGDGTSGSGSNPSHTYSTPGTYSVTLVATNGAGCTGTALRSGYVTVFTPPIADFITAQYSFCSAPQTVSFTNTSSGFTPLTASWDFGNGYTSSNFAPPSTVYPTGGFFPVRLQITDGHGCISNKSAGINIISTPAQISRPAAVCPGDTVLLMNSTPGNNGSTWHFGPNDSLTGNPVKHRFPPSGSFPVTLTTIVGSCVKSTTDTITISPKPSASISMSPAFPCPLPSAVTFTANSPLATGYQWSWQSGGTASGQTVTKSYPRTLAKYKADVVRLITTSAAGCKDTATIDTVYIRDIKVAISPGALCDPNLITAGCVPFTINFSVDLYTSLPDLTPPPCKFAHYPFSPSTWSWNFGDGGTSTASSPAHTFTQVGDYLVRCIITTPNGCTDTGFTHIHVDTPVHPSFVAITPITICPRKTVSFRNTTDTPLANTVYRWSTIGSQVQRSDTGNATLTFNYPGPYTVHLYTDHRGCIDTFEIPNYVTVYPPGSHFRDSIYCSPSKTVAFFNTSYQATSHYWDFDDGTTDTALNPLHTYAVEGVYFVKLITYNSTYGCSDTDTHLVQPMTPILGIAASDQSVCKDDSVHFIPSFNGDTTTIKVKYGWAADGVQTPFDSVNAEWDHRFHTNGYYTVKLFTRFGNGCVDSLIKPAFIAVAKPAANFSASPPVGCQPQLVLFTDSSSDLPGIALTSRTWIYGDGDTSKNAGASSGHVYLHKGRYNAGIIVTDSFGCSDTLIRANYVDIRRPNAGFTVSDFSVCTHQAINFNAGNATGLGTLQYHWNFGDGGTAGTMQATHQYSNTGFYNIRLVVSDTTGCTDTLLRTNYIEVKAPHAAFTVSDSVTPCPVLIDTFFNATTGAVSYLWDLGTGGSPATVANPTKTYIGTGIYHVTLVAADQFGCTDTARKDLRILGYPGSFSYGPLKGCVPMQVTFSSPVGNVPLIQWDFRDGATGSGVTTTHTYLTPGVYVPRVIYSDSQTCNAISLGLDTIRVDQFKADFSWTLPCAGTPFSLKDSSHYSMSAPNTWLWHFSGTDSATGATPSYTAAMAGSMQVSMIAHNTFGCADTVTKTVVINPLPPVAAPGDTAICPGDTLLLAGSGAIRYHWATNAGQFLSCPMCDSTYFSPGTASSSVIFLSGTDTNGCAGHDSMIVTIQVKTTSSVGTGGEICTGETFRLHASGAISYTWSPSSTLDSPFIASPLASPLITTTYTVAAKEGTCLVDSERVTVVVHQLPFFDAGYDEIINLGSAVILQATQNGIDHIIWKADSTLSCNNCFRPTAHPLYTTTYFATAYDAFGCYVTDSVTVRVRCNGDSVFIPNTFTPNGDGLNDYFFPRGKGIDFMSSIRIYNRWGELVFEKLHVAVNDERAGWDGTFKGRALPPDTYIYTMQTHCVTGEPVTWKGDITLIR